MQPKKREITKKNVSVPVLFLYFKSYLYKTLIYSVLSYIKITFSRFQSKDKSDYTFINYMYAAAATYKDNEYFGPNRVFRPIFRSKRTIRRSFPQKSPLNFANSRNVRIFAIPKPIEPPRSARRGGQKGEADRTVSPGLQGLMAEWLGTALQKLIQRFKSASDLTKAGAAVFATPALFCFVR